jgi:hypothetical protein
VALAATLSGAEFSGYVSDAACGWNNARDDPHAKECARQCVRQGWAPVLVPDGKYDAVRIANKDKAAAFVGEHVTIQGRLDGGTLTIASIRASAPPPTAKKPDSKDSKR